MLSSSGETGKPMNGVRIIVKSQGTLLPGTNFGRPRHRTFSMGIGVHEAMPYAPTQSMLGPSSPASWTTVQIRNRYDFLGDSFAKNRSVLMEDYEHFTTPHVPIPQSKAARKSAEQSAQQSRERNEMRSSGKTDD